MVNRTWTHTMGDRQSLASGANYFLRDKNENSWPGDKSGFHQLGELQPKILVSLLMAAVCTMSSCLPCLQGFSGILSYSTSILPWSTCAITLIFLMLCFLSMRARSWSMENFTIFAAYHKINAERRKKASSPCSVRRLLLPRCGWRPCERDISVLRGLMKLWRLTLIWNLNGR